MDGTENERPAQGSGYADVSTHTVPTSAPGDSRSAIGYLLWPGADDYIAIMDLLEASVTEMTAADVAAVLASAGHRLPAHVVETRLDSLKNSGAVSARSDTSRARRYSELLARNWRYTASPVGRQVQRFYRQVLAATPTMREIPIRSLNLLVTNLEKLVGEMNGAVDPPTIAARNVDTATIIFTSHDTLDAALVGAEDLLTGLADRFDLDDERTGELKGLLVEYAKRVADVLDTGSACAAAALDVLAPHFNTLAAAVVNASDASELIAVGALSASRGGRVEDWTGLRDWCDGHRGRAAHFSLRLVHALPGMHANLRRLHSSSGTATNRARALSFARAVLTDGIGTQVFQAAVGDHPWRKLYGTADEDDAGRNPSWRDGPTVPVPELLRTHGRSGPRGRGTKPRDDSAARAEIEAARAQRRAIHEAALAEVLASVPGQTLSSHAARAALAALMAASRAAPSGARRTATVDGLACTLVHIGDVAEDIVGTLAASTWRVFLPGRIPLFHPRGRKPNTAQLAMLTELTAISDTDRSVAVRLTPVTGDDVEEVVA